MTSRRGETKATKVFRAEYEKHRETMLSISGCVRAALKVALPGAELTLGSGEDPWHATYEAGGGAPVIRARGRTIVAAAENLCDMVKGKK